MLRNLFLHRLGIEHRTLAFLAIVVPIFVFRSVDELAAASRALELLEVPKLGSVSPAEERPGHCLSEAGPTIPHLPSADIHGWVLSPVSPAVIGFVH